jgi:hypothetical protein
MLPVSGIFVVLASALGWYKNPLGREEGGWLTARRVVSFLCYLSERERLKWGRIGYGFRDGEAQIRGGVLERCVRANENMAKIEKSGPVLDNSHALLGVSIGTEVMQRQSEFEYRMLRN